MRSLFEFENLQELLNDQMLYAYYIDFCNLLPGHFGISDNASKIVLLNHCGLEAADLTLDELVGHDYLSFRTNLVELASDFFTQDRCCKLRNTDVVTLSWAQYGKDKQWDLSISTRKPILNKENAMIGLTNHVLSIKEIFFDRLYEFFKEHELRKLFGFDKQFSVEVTSHDTCFNLSARQMEVLFFLLCGKTSKEIAKILNLSTRTAESYLEAIKLKFNCDTKSQLIEKSILAGYLGILPQTLLRKIIK